ncbi:MFS transporter [Pseudaestuariivita sp.]|uniref:MFS transporter n=1 Tax=Pseudaestuariivita sp. TaxID=2211669 RepID=UPI00405A2784
MTSLPALHTSWSRGFRLSRATLPAFMAEGAVWGTYAAYVPDIKAGLEASDGAFGVALLFGSAGAVCAMLLAPLFDRVTGKFGMAIGALMLVIAAQVMVSAPVLWVFAVFLFFTGGASGLHDVVMNARLAGIEGAERVSLMNLNHGFFSVAYAIAAFSAGLAREAGVPVETTFGVWFALIALGAWWMIEPPREAPEDDGKSAGFKLSRPVWWGGLIVLVAFLTENAAEGWSALHIERSLGGNATEGALGPTMLGITMAIGRLSGQAVVARFSEASVTFWAALLSASGALIAAMAQVEWVAYLGFAVLGLGVSVIAPMVLALVGRRVPAHRRTVAISRVAVIGYLGFFVGPPMMGLVSEAVGLRWSFVCVAVVLALVPLFLVMLRREDKV